MSTDKTNVMDINMTPEEDAIDFLELARVILHKLWLLIIAAVLGAAIAGIYTAEFVAPQYKSSSLIYIYSKTTSITSLADLQVGSQLAVDFQIVATTREVIEKVIDNLQMNTTYEAMLKRVSITNPSGSHMLKIEVTDSDPIQAANISNAIADELRERIADVMNTDEPSVVEKAVAARSPSSPSLKKNAAIGGVGCAFLVAAIIAVAYLMDDTIKTDEDVRKYLHLNTLAAIPQERTGRKAAEPKKESTQVS